MGGARWREAGAGWRGVGRGAAFQKVKLGIDGSELRRKVPFIFIGNNTYEMDLYNIGTRKHLDEGKLCVYLLRKSGRTGLLLLILRSVFGGLRHSKYFESFSVTSLSVETNTKSTLVAMDGEVASLDSPLEYRILPRQLRVTAPETKE